MNGGSRERAPRNSTVQPRCASLEAACKTKLTKVKPNCALARNGYPSGQNRERLIAIHSSFVFIISLPLLRAERNDRSGSLEGKHLFFSILRQLTKRILFLRSRVLSRSQLSLIVYCDNYYLISAEVLYCLILLRRFALSFSLSLFLSLMLVIKLRTLSECDSAFRSRIDYWGFLCGMFARCLVLKREQIWRNCTY